MGQKVNPHGLRVGVIKDWDSRWYADADFADYLVEDYNIRTFLKKKLYSAGVSKIEIERASDRVKIIVYTAKPGVVIGKGGSEIEKVKAEIKKNVKVGCTGCGYCMPCPRGVDIPGTFRCYNAMYSEGKKSGRRDYLQCTAFRKDTSSASQCISCGKCETHCPQHIEIRKELKNAAAELEDVKYKVMKTGIQLLKLW